MKIAHTKLTENELQKRHYAFPEKRKFPLPDRDHVLSAIRFFNYVEAKDERILANAILKRMKELGMSNVNVGPTNRFRKYYSGSELKHYGVKGMKWGVRRTPEQLGHPASVKDWNISPNQTVYRIDRKSEPFSSHKKEPYTFASTTTVGRYSYRTHGKEFFRNGNERLYEYEMNPKKQLKIAGGKTIVEELMNYNNDPRYNEFKNKNISSFSTMNKYLVKNGIKDKYIVDFADRSKMNSEIVKRLSKKGYQGMTDLLDAQDELTPAPAIIFNPKRNLKVKKIINEEDWYKY